MVGVAGVFALTVKMVHGARGGLISTIGLDRNRTWLATFTLVAGSFAAVGILIKNRWDGTSVRPRNKFSPSCFQLVVWTLVVCTWLLQAGLADFRLEDGAPLDITIPTDVWPFLGFGSFTLVASPAFLANKDRCRAMDTPHYLRDSTIHHVRWLRHSEDILCSA